ncbi:MAG: pyridoxal phosphate-dependent aminotransferase [Deltaproteobacteria bacterium]|nr:pyridoxal phosphate-dependent aminotransferase [Deltaproteobacteria bacterium]
MFDISAMKEGGIVAIRDALIERQQQGFRIARTESGDPSFEVPLLVRRAMEEALVGNKTHYTPAAGIPELRQAIVEKMKRETGVVLDGPQGVMVTAGAMNGLYVLFGALLGDGKDHEVLVPTPTWTETVTNIELNGGRPVYYGVDPFADKPIDVEALAAKITPRTAALVINTPHNPTGVVLNKETLQALVALCERKGIYLVSDEAYEHVVYPPARHISPLSLSDYERVVGVYSCSKSYAMSGLRVGYLVTRGGAIRPRLARYLRCTVNGVNSVAQHGAAAAIADGVSADIAMMQEEYALRRRTLLAALERCTVLEPFAPGGAFYVWARMSDWGPIAAAVGKEPGVCDGWDATAYLLEHGVGSAPGEVFGPGGPGALRLSFSCPTEQVEMAADVLSEL